MMIRLLALALCADGALAFGPGLSTDDEPDLSARDPTGAIEPGSTSAGQTSEA